MAKSQAAIARELIYDKAILIKPETSPILRGRILDQIEGMITVCEKLGVFTRQDGTALYSEAFARQFKGNPDNEARTDT